MPDEVQEFKVTFGASELEALARDTCRVPKPFLVSQVSFEWEQCGRDLTVVFTIHPSANTQE